MNRPSVQSRDSIAGELRACRARARLTRQQTADALGVHVNTISNWERGEAAVPAERLSDLAETFGVDVAVLLP